MVMRIGPREAPPPPKVQPKPSAPPPGAASTDATGASPDSGWDTGAHAAVELPPPEISVKVPMEVDGETKDVELKVLGKDLLLDGQKVGTVTAQKADGTLELDVGGKPSSAKPTVVQPPAVQVSHAKSAATANAPPPAGPDQQAYPGGRPESYIKTQFPAGPGDTVDRQTMIDTIVGVAPKEKQAELRDLLQTGGAYAKKEVNLGDTVVNVGVPDAAIQKAFEQVLEARKSPGTKPLSFEFTPERTVQGPEMSGGESGSSYHSTTVETGSAQKFNLSLSVDAQGKVNGKTLGVDQLTRLSTELSHVDNDLKMKALTDAGVPADALGSGVSVDMALAKLRQATLTPGKHTVDFSYDETVTIGGAESGDSHTEIHHHDLQVKLQVDDQGHVNGKPLEIESTLATNKVYEKMSTADKKALLKQVGFKDEDLSPMDKDPSRTTSFLTKIALMTREPGQHQIELDNGPDKFAVGCKVSDKGELEGVGVQKLPKPKKQSGFMKIIGPILTIASFVFPPAAPFLQVINAGLSIASGAKGLALVGSVLGAAAGIGNIAGLGSVASTLNTASQVVQGVDGAIKGIKNGDYLGALGSALGAGAGVADLGGAGNLAGTLRTASNVADAAGSAVHAVKTGDIAGALGSALEAGSGLADLAGDEGLSKTLDRAGSVAKGVGGVIRGVKTGDLGGALGSALQAGQSAELLAGDPDAARTLGNAARVVNGVSGAIRGIRSGDYSAALGAAAGALGGVGGLTGDSSLPSDETLRRFQRSAQLGSKLQRGLERAGIIPSGSTPGATPRLRLKPLKVPLSALGGATIQNGTAMPKPKPGATARGGAIPMPKPGATVRSGIPGAGGGAPASSASMASASRGGVSQAKSAATGEGDDGEVDEVDSSEEVDSSGDASDSFPSEGATAPIQAVSLPADFSTEDEGSGELVTGAMPAVSLPTDVDVAYAGGSPTFDESGPEIAGASPEEGGTGAMPAVSLPADDGVAWAGGSPTFDESGPALPGAFAPDEGGTAALPAVSLPDEGATGALPAVSLEGGDDTGDVGEPPASPDDGGNQVGLNELASDGALLVDDDGNVAGIDLGVLDPNGPGGQVSLDDLDRLGAVLYDENGGVAGLDLSVLGGSAEPVEPLPGATDVIPEDGVVTVESGETLSSIARRYLGDASRYPEIYALNKDSLGDNPNRLRAGAELVLPGAGDTIDPSERNDILNRAGTLPSPGQQPVAPGRGDDRVPDGIDAMTDPSQYGDDGTPWTPPADVVARFNAPERTVEPNGTLESIARDVEVFKNSKLFADTAGPSMREALEFVEKAALEGDSKLMAMATKMPGFKQALDVMKNSPSVSALLDVTGPLFKVASPVLAFADGLTQSGDVSTQQRISDGVANATADILTSANPVVAVLDAIPNIIGLVTDDKRPEQYTIGKNLEGGIKSLFALIADLPEDQKMAAITRVRQDAASGKLGAVIKLANQAGEGLSNLLMEGLDQLENNPDWTPPPIY